MNNILIKLGIVFFYLQFYITIAISTLFKSIRYLFHLVTNSQNKRISLDPHESTHPLVFEDISKFFINVDKVIEKDGF